MNKKVGLRVVIILGWLVAIGILAYSPYLIDFFVGKEKELRIITYTYMVPPETLKAFKDKTGVDVQVSYYESDGELLAKLNITGGSEYDLILASDYVTNILRKKGLIKKIEGQKFADFESIDGRLVKQSFDPENEFSVPVMWEVMGLSYDKEIFGELQDVSWDRVFRNPNSFGKDHKISMVDEPREALFLSSLYLFGTDAKVSAEKLDEIKKLLIEQKNWVENYTSDMQDYFLMSGASAIVVIPSSYTKRIFWETDQFEFVIPREGSLLMVYNLVVPAANTNKNVEKFIEFFMTVEQTAIRCNRYGLFPANKKAYDLLDPIFEKIGFISEKTFEKLGMLRDELSRRQLEDLWLSVKAT